MKKIFCFVIVLNLLMTAGCVSENVSADGGKSAARPESVIRSGRRDPLLKADYVLSVLGEPSVKRYENPSEVWVYPQEGCVLFVYMNDQKDGSKLVRHMEIGTPTFKAKQKDSLPCLETAAGLR